ncbi:MAG: triose-phosphate isomerase [Bacteroidota bacterium]
MKILAGNWKMNTTFEEGYTLIEALKTELSPERLGDVVVVVAPPAIQLTQAIDLLIDYPEMAVAAQNGHAQDSGAFTGEVSMAQLADAGADAVILGHSERRQYFGETDRDINAKTRAALAHELRPIVCVGEDLSVRKAGNHLAVVEAQLRAALEGIDGELAENVVIAYEPVWAIGTGETATAAQAQEMHAHLRGVLRQTYGELADHLPILYGGSCKPSNAAELFAQPDVNGGLIGGASLSATDFIALADLLKNA